MDRTVSGRKFGNFKKLRGYNDMVILPESGA